jgi:hypothetical protein
LGHLVVHRPTLEALLEDYWRLMPPYQGVKLEDIQVLRILFGFFPTYRQSPLRPSFDRLLQVGRLVDVESREREERERERGGERGSEGDGERERDSGLAFEKVYIMVVTITIIIIITIVVVGAE